MSESTTERMFRPLCDLPVGSIIVTVEHVMSLWGRLTSLRIDIELLKLAANDPDTLRDREMQALQVGLELRHAVGGRLQ